MNPLIDKSDVLRLADQASDFYIDGKVSSLTAAVVDALGDTQYNNEQIARVVEATNQAAWNKLASTDCPHKIRFEPAALDGVVSTKNEDESEVEKTASSSEFNYWLEKTASTARPSSLSFLETIPMNRLEEILFDSPMEKEASLRSHGTEEYDLGAIPSDELADWDRVAAKVAEAKSVIQEQIDCNEIGFAEAIGELLKTANQMLLEGSTPEEISYVVKEAAAGDVGTALVSFLNKEAFAHHDPRDDAFEAFIARGQKTDDGRATLWDRPDGPGFDKQASSKFRSFLERVRTSDGINPEHPLVKAAKTIGELRKETLVLSAAREDLAEKHAQATRMALRGEGVSHV